jgi:methionyl aminopeptidase
MRTNAPKELFTENSLVRLKGKDWLDKQRVAGRIAAETLSLLQEIIFSGEHTKLSELNKIAEDYIVNAGGICTFKGYKGFPAGVCISVNKQLVHGIPTDYVLQEGDLVSFDLGVTIGGAIADTAITCIFGQPKSDQHVRLVKATEEALMKGIQAIKVGDRLGAIGYAISRCGKGYGYGVINNYGGHGLDWDIPHAPPFVENKSDPEKGIRIQPGLAIAIEPMFVLGSTVTTTLDDGWTVVTPDLSAHFEHSVFVHESHVEIITDRIITKTPIQEILDYCKNLINIPYVYSTDWEEIVKDSMNFKDLIPFVGDHSQNSFYIHFPNPTDHVANSIREKLDAVAKQEPNLVWCLYQQNNPGLTLHTISSRSSSPEQIVDELKRLRNLKAFL